MRVSSVSVTSLVPSVADVTCMGSSNFVSLETIGGSTTGVVSVFASLELVLDVSVGVLKKKNLPLRCRGSDPLGGSDVPFETMSVNVRALSSAP